MATYRSFEAAAPKPPPEVVTLGPSAFLPTWADAPQEPVRIGMSLLSATDIEACKVTAAQEAWKAFPRKEDEAVRLGIFNDIAIRYLVARAACDPDDASKPCPVWAVAPDDIVKEFVSTEGLKHLFDALERATVTMSPCLKEADDDAIEDFPYLVFDSIDRLPQSRARRVRRLIAFCIAELTESG